MFTSVKFQNFKGFRDYSISLRETNVLVGPNNAGKSSALDAFRALSVALKYAHRRNPKLISDGDETFYGYDIPVETLPISLANVHSDYHDELSTAVHFKLDNGNRLRLSFHDYSRCILTYSNSGPAIRSTSQFKKAFPVDISYIPTLGPLEEEERVLTDQWVEQSQRSRYIHRVFRNYWYRQSEKFSEFKRMVEETWPGMSIQPPERYGFAPPKLTMYCEEDRKVRELSWAGFGFQIWLQILTYIINSASSSMLIVDEPEIYLHPDLQHRLFRLLKSLDKQTIIATHSVEIVNEAEHDEVVLVNRKRSTAKRVGDVEGLQEALFSIGSAQNIHLAKLSKDKKVLFFEGEDFKLIKRFATRAGLNALSEDISLTIVPIGGFSQRHKILEVAWTFEKVLKAEISIAALLDRDYRCDEEINEIIEATRSKIPRFHILGAKEIENYLLVPNVISRAVQTRLREQKLGLTISTEKIEELLCLCTDELKSEIGAQLVIGRSRYLSGRSKEDDTTIAKTTLKKFEADWGDIGKRLKLVPGKQVLSALNKSLHDLYKVSITSTQIINHMTLTDIPNDLMSILSDFNTMALSAGDPV